MGVPMYKKLGIPYRLEGVRTPTAEEIKEAEMILKG
jgi:pyruvate formate lyase activating enzyme